MRLVLLVPARTTSDSARSTLSCVRVGGMNAFELQNGSEFAVLRSCRQLRLPSTFSSSAQF